MSEAQGWRIRAAPIVGSGHFAATTNGAEWTVRVPQHDPVFAGHFPEVPIFPGVYTLDLIYQAAERFFQRAGHEIALAKVHSVRYIHPIGPNDLLWITINIDEDSSPSVAVQAIVRRDGHKVVTAKIFVRIVR